jgi:signal peptidase I
MFKLLSVLILGSTIITACSQSSTTLLASSDMEGTIHKGATVTFVSFEKGKLNRNDIVLFDSHVKELNETYPKMLRVVGLPGDRVEVRGGEFFVNAQLFRLPSTSKFSYYVKTRKDFTAISGGKYANRKWDENTWFAFLDEREAEQVRQLPQLDSFRRLVSDSTFQESGVVTDNDFQGKNAYYWGPYIIPKKGELIDKRLIGVAPNYLTSSDEGSKIEDNYYFLIADNQFASIDSRYIGLVPDKVMKGILKKSE